MQIFIPFDQEDQVLVAKIRPHTTQDALNFCSKYSSLAKIACFNQMWPLFYDEFYNPEGISKYCQHYDPKYKNYCHNTVIGILTSNLELKEDVMLNYCSKLISPSPGECLGISAVRIFEIDTKNENKAISLCKKGAPFDPEGLCFTRLIDKSVYIFKDPKNQKPLFCNRLDQPWKKQCLNSL